MPNKFWDFSVKIYQYPEAEKACLELQDNHGLSVVMLLYCIWVGVFRGEFEDDIYAKANTFSLSWDNEVVTPLREIRRWMKSSRDEQMISGAPLREQIKAVELDAEHFQMNILEGLYSETKGMPFDTEEQLLASARNLARYCADNDVVFDTSLLKPPSVLLAAAIENITTELASSALSGTVLQHETK